MPYGRQALWEDDVRWKSAKGQVRRRWRVTGHGEPKVLWARTPAEAARLFCRIRGAEDPDRLRVQMVR